MTSHPISQEVIEDPKNLGEAGAAADAERQAREAAAQRELVQRGSEPSRGSERVSAPEAGAEDLPFLAE